MSVAILGIRHHGPGSARNVRAALEQLQPDVVLVEGPPEADALLAACVHPGMRPPVALLAYVADEPQRAAFYPFAEFSPEWQAITYAVAAGVPVRFCDMPLAHGFAVEKETEDADEETTGNEAEEEKRDVPRGESPHPYHSDPIDALAQIAGYDNGEEWWEHMVERCDDSALIFDAVMDAMHELRLQAKRELRRENIREAFMRKAIRQAEKEGFSTIAVVCGAWHAPALRTMPSQKEDNDLVKGLPKVKVECTWVSWTYRRLALESGYGAGVQSPGWYHHLWRYTTDTTVQWIAHVARLFRQKNIDVSVAHCIEAVRLADTLAALRGIARPGLRELNEAVQSVMCMGDDILLRLVRDELIVSERMGTVPSDIPKAPLQRDIEKLQKQLRLPAEAVAKEYVLDLRKENDLQRSQLLHRLVLLGIPWGKSKYVSGKGTFKEGWDVQWTPELSLALIDMGAWGNTVEEAASAFAVHSADHASDVQKVCALLLQAVPAELPRAVERIVVCLDTIAAATSDVLQLMAVVPDVVSLARYGNVRKTDATMVAQIADSIIVRACVGLPHACIGVDEEAAAQVVESVARCNDAIVLQQQEEQIAQWHSTLMAIAHNDSTSPMLAGYAVRLLRDAGAVQGSELAHIFSYALSPAQDSGVAAAWLEGFLKGSGTVLLVDDELWHTVYTWVEQLDMEVFTALLPLLRRTFARFGTVERRKMGEKVRTGSAVTTGAQHRGDTCNHEYAARALPMLVQIVTGKEMYNAE